MSSVNVRKVQTMLLDPTVTKTEVVEDFCISSPTLNKLLSKWNVRHLLFIHFINWTFFSNMA